VRPFYQPPSRTPRPPTVEINDFLEDSKITIRMAGVPEHYNN